MDELFSGTAEVSIQGERVLRFLDCTGNQAKYEVIGFETVPVVIVDSRLKGLLAIQGLLETGDLHAFAPKFNHPAKVRIVQGERGEVIIQLSDAEEYPCHILWIAVGLRDSLPVYEYEFETIAPLSQEDGYAIIAVYQLSPSEGPALSSLEVSSASYVSSLSA